MDSMNPKASKITIRNQYTTIITFSPDSRYLMTGNGSEYVRRWKLNSDIGNEVGPAMQSTGRVNAIAASTDGRWIVTSDSRNTVIVWNAVTHTIAREISEHTSSVNAVDVSSDSTRIASGSSDRTVRIFDIFSGVGIFPPLVPAHDKDVVDVKFSPDGSRVATDTSTLLGVYDARSGNKLFEISVQSTFSTLRLAWSFDGQQLFFSSSGKITCFDGSTSTRSHLAWSINLNDFYRAPAVTHGRFIAYAAGFGVSFLDYTSGKQIGSIIDHPTAVNCLSVSPDGRYLACGRDRVITVHSLSDYLPRDYLRIPRVPRIPLVEVDDPLLESWILGLNPPDIKTKEPEIAQRSDPNHHAHRLAAKSIIRARLKEWQTAIEDAEMSLQIKQLPIGHIARSIALVGAGKQEIALDDFELAFCYCDPTDNMLLLVIKSILVFMCGKREQAISRLRYLIDATDAKTKGHYIPVLGNMYLKHGDYENAVQTLVLAKKTSTSDDSNALMTISLIFDWNFDLLEDIACQRLCESLHPSGRIKEVGETLLKMVSGLAEDEKEPAHGRILQELVTRSGQVTLLTWTGRSSKCNSCLPSSPAVYRQQPVIPPHLEPAELEIRTDELRAILPLVDAAVIYDRITRFQPVRFVHFRLLLPCIVFGVKSLRRMPVPHAVYRAETAGLGVVEFATEDTLPMKEPQRLVFADLRIHGLRLESDTEWSTPDMGNTVAGVDVELVHAPMIEEVPSAAPQLDTCTRALQLIARLGQPFSALLFLRKSDGSYRRIAADKEIVVRGTGNTISKDICVEVLEIL